MEEEGDHLGDGDYGAEGKEQKEQDHRTLGLAHLSGASFCEACFGGLWPHCAGDQTRGQALRGALEGGARET